MCRSGHARQTEEKEKIKTERPVATAAGGGAGGGADGDGAAARTTEEEVPPMQDKIGLASNKRWPQLRELVVVVVVSSSLLRG